ncbi:MAG: phosphatidylglycerophosphatase A [Brevinematia bacterium]
MKVVMDLLVRFLATGIFVSYIPWARGTFGTLIGVIIFVFLSGYPVIFYLVLAILTILAFPITSYAEREIFKNKDSEYIVIDEIVGYLISTIGFKFSPDIEGFTILVLTFVIFRVFDIFKPYPIIHIQSVEGVGIVLDDIFAGVATNIVVRILLSLELFKFFTPIL